MKKVWTFVGGQWGDEGKGKLIHCKVSDFIKKQSISPEDIFVFRWNGGNNAGHTVVLRDGTQFAFHLLPSAVIVEGVNCVLGHGMVISPLVLRDEILKLVNKGYKPKLIVSPRATVITEYHCLWEKKIEGILAGKKVGTTGRGIGTAYASKMLRIAPMIQDLLSKRVLVEKLELFAKIELEGIERRLSNEIAQELNSLHYMVTLI